MPDPPHVSVIIIFYNAQPFLEEAVESVVAQSYEDWELLLVDDGSSDGSTELAQRYARHHSDQIRYYCHEGHVNRGMSATRNLGLQHARGRYVAFLDADDVWSPHTLREQVQILHTHPSAAMVYGPIEWWYSWTGDAADDARDFIEGLSVSPNRLYEPGQLVPSLLKNEIAIPSGMLLRRTAVEFIGGFETEFTDLFEDQAFCLKLCLHHPVYAAGTSWYKYRQHPDSCCNTAMRTSSFQFSEPNPAHRSFLQWAEKYLRNHAISEPAIWRALVQARWPYDYPELHSLINQFRRLLVQAQGLWPFQRSAKSLAKQLTHNVLPENIYLRLWRHWQRNGPSMETLAIVAHQQPISKQAIRAIQGIDPSPILDRLVSMKLIQITDHSELPNRSRRYQTTEYFLQQFELDSLGELPTLTTPAFERELDRTSSFSETAIQPFSHGTRSAR